MKNNQTNNFLSNNFIVFFLINLGNLFSYIFQILLGSHLRLYLYGEFNALNSLLIYIGPIAIIIPLVISRYVALFSIRDFQKLNSLIRYVFKNIVILSLAILIFLFCLSKFIFASLNISSINNLYFSFLFISLTLIAVIPGGVLQGTEKFMKFSIICSLPLYLKVLFVLILISFHILSIQNIFIILIISILIPFFLGLYLIRKNLVSQNTKILHHEKKDIYKYILPIFLSTILIQTLTNSDIILARYFLDPYLSGAYSMSSVLSKIVYFLPASLIFVLFPKVVKENEENIKSKSILISLALTTLIGIIGLLMIYVFKYDIINFTFKKTDLEIGNSFFYLSLSMFFYSLVNIIISAYAAKNDFSYLIIIILGIILYVALFYFNHDNIYALINNMIIISLFIFFSLLFFLFIKSKKNYFYKI